MKLLEVLSGPRLTSDDINTAVAIGAGQAELDDVLFDKLFQIFAFETGDMPYGTAKARTGDPYQWIQKHLARMTPVSIKHLLRQYADEAQRSV